MPMKPSSIVHTLPYPALEAGNLSFPEGSYETEVSVRADGFSVDVEHTITGAPFIEKLIADQQAKFYCLLSIPKAGVRRLCETGMKGPVQWSAGEQGEPPKLRPMLLYTGNGIEHQFTDSCGVADIWVDSTIKLPKGARLARGEFYNVTPSDYAFIRFKEKKEYDHGVFTVSENTEDGFYFIVYTATDVLRFVQNPSENRQLREAIMTGIVARCFSILQERNIRNSDDQDEDVTGFQAFPNLKVLSSKLIAEIGHDWLHEDFDPMHAATSMYPVQVPIVHHDEDEDSD